MYNKYVQVIINNNSKSTDQLFTYGIPMDYEQDIEAGKRVKVSFGNNKHMMDALVVSVDETCDLPCEKIKPILDILDDAPVVKEEMIKLALKQLSNIK